MKFKVLKVISICVILISTYSHGSVILLSGYTEAISNDTITDTKQLDITTTNHASTYVSVPGSRPWYNGKSYADAYFSWTEDIFGVITIEGRVYTRSNATAVSLDGYTSLYANIQLTTEYNYEYSTNVVTSIGTQGSNIQYENDYGTQFLGTGSKTQLAADSNGLLGIGVYDILADVYTEVRSSPGNGITISNADLTFNLKLTPTTAAGKTAEVPEPSTIAIFALGLMGLASRRFQKQT
jgi:hypothetical protein